MNQANPFTPTFGIVPPRLAGRTEIINDLSQAFESGPGNPNLSTILIGARGCGKTALLSCIRDEAEQRRWIAVNVVASKGMLEDILQRALEASAEFVEPKSRKHLTGLNVAQILGIEWAVDPETQANWRTRMNALFSELEKHGIGLLICVDEVNVHVEEMVQLASIYQLFIGEGKKVSLVMAGLPKNTTDLIDDDRVSFLRRARQRRLERISDAEIELAFRGTVEDAGKRIDDAGLERAVEAIDGYPYMMQLVGYFAWANSGASNIITLRDAERGAGQARREFKAGVLESTYREMSAGDRAFVMAMLPDQDGSRIADVAERMGKKTNYASTYKTRLLAQGVICEGPGSTFDFALPSLRDYLEDKREQR